MRQKLGVRSQKSRVSVLSLLFLLTTLHFPLFTLYYGCASKKNMEMPDAQMKAVGYNQTGIEAVEAGDYNMALIEFKISLSLNSGLDNRNGVAINYLNLGRLYLLMDSLDDAKRLFEESIKIGLDINDQFILSEAYASIGRYYYLSGNSKEAIDILEKAAAIDRREDYATIGSKLNIMGMVYRDDNRLNEAERAFNDALNINKSYKMDEDVADSFRGLGDIFFKKWDYKKARESYENAISIDRRLGIRSKISLDLSSLGTLSLMENDANGALDLFLRAYAVDSGRGDNKRTLKDLDRIIEIYKESGDKNNADAYSLKKERLLRKE